MFKNTRLCMLLGGIACITITGSTRSLREPSRGSCDNIYAYFTPRGPRITNPNNGCDQFSRFCGTWEQTDGQTVNYSKITRKLCAGGGHSAHHACVTTMLIYQHKIQRRKCNYYYEKHRLPPGAIKGVTLLYLCILLQGVPGLHTQKWL